MKGKLTVKEVNGIFKIWSGKDWCFLCELVNGEWQDCTFSTEESAEREIERIRDHEEAIEQSTDEAWQRYCKKWNIVEEG
jgi:hypothetical protein